MLTLATQIIPVCYNNKMLQAVTPKLVNTSNPPTGQKLSPVKLVTEPTPQHKPESMIKRNLLEKRIRMSHF